MFETDNFSYSLEAEQVYLGSLLYEPELIKETTIKVEYLSPGKHAMLLSTLYEMDSASIPIELLFVVEHLGSGIEDIGGIAYISELINGVHSTSNFKGYEKIIIEHYQQRKALEVANKIKSEEISISEAVSELIAIEDNDIDDDDGDITEHLKELYERLEGGGTTSQGTLTGFRDLDKLTNGLQDEDLVIIAARPSVGKTAFALNLMDNLAKDIVENKEVKQGDVVVLFSLEMPVIQLLTRFVGFKGLIDSQLMRQSEKFTSSDWTKATMSIGELQNAPIKIFDKPSVDVNYIYRKVRKVKRQFPGRKVKVFIDYLQLIQGNPIHKGNKQQEVADISRNLKLMARELKVNVTALSQLSRSVEQRQDKRPMLSDLRESGAIEQDADVIAFLYREDYYDKETENQNMIEIIIAKQRNGGTGTVTLAFIKEFQKFVNIDWSNHQQ